MKEPDAELPQLKQIVKDKDPSDLLKKAAKILKCNIDKFQQSPRIHKENMQERDILLYFLWETGLYTNRQIGNLFGITYSAVSRRVHITKSRISKHNVIGRKYEHLKSLIKV